MEHVLPACTIYVLFDCLAFEEPTFQNEYFIFGEPKEYSAK